MLNAEDPHDEIFYMPVLSFAIAGGHPEMADPLIRLGAAVKPYSAQMLFLAAKLGRIDLVELLAANGALMSCIEAALVVAQDIDLFSRLLGLKTAAERDAFLSEMTLLPIVRGDRAERPDKVAVLLDHGVDINAAGDDGRTALHVTARSGRVRVMSLLLDRGADPAKRDAEGNTPADLARAAGNTDAVALLASR